MRKGEKAVLTCRADYAYGEAGSPPKIPANATLQFEVELLDWVSEKASRRSRARAGPSGLVCIGADPASFFLDCRTSPRARTAASPRPCSRRALDGPSHRTRTR